jgi:hypothetical protein
MNNRQHHQPTESEIWALQDKNPVGEQEQQQEWPERTITWNPRWYYIHGVGSSYKAKSGFEFLFHFLQDKAFSKHKKERVLRILFANKGRGVKLISPIPLTFIVVSYPETKTHAAHVYSVTLTRYNSLHCECEWEQSTAQSETCTHCISVRAYGHFLDLDRVIKTSKLQGETEIYPHI